MKEKATTMNMSKEETIVQYTKIIQAGALVILTLLNLVVLLQIKDILSNL